MSISAGTRLGPYEILAPLGAGGMGEVWKARDTRLDRTVAVKVLPAHMAGVGEARQRFEREARAVSALNHSRICTLFDIGSENGTDYLVMEFVEGETLAARLQRGAMPLAEALQAAIQIADALDKAHRAGIVHRDLKPGNIMLAPGGVKVLDFGLAKVVPKASAAAALPSATPTQLETRTAAAPLTGVGAILGTLQYMAPEQLEGKEADTRSDLFAFGAVLHEMLSGKRAFEAKSQAGVMAAILEHDPPALRTLQPAAPAALERVLQRCLEKDPERRWQSAGDLRADLEWIAAGRAQPDSPVAAASPSPRLLPWGIAAACLLAAALCAGLLLVRPRPEIHAARFILRPPPEASFANIYAATAISPDGTLIVYSAVSEKKPVSLWVRPLDSLAALPLEGTEGGNYPFWSADSKSVAFWSDGKLRRIDIGGGAPLTLCDWVGPAPAGGAWREDGTIVFGGADGLYRVSASGGVPVRITHTEAARHEVAHGFPQFLPGGKRFLYFIQSSDPNVQGVYLGSFERPDERVQLVRTPYKTSYQPPQSGAPGRLLFMRERTLLAQRFDPSSGKLEGEADLIAEDVATHPTDPRAAFWASPNGVLLYRSGREIFSPAWFGRDGKRLGDAASPDAFENLRLSPDGKQAAISRTIANNTDLWLLEFGRGALSHLTYAAGRYSIRGNPRADDCPVWSPDGRQVAFASDRDGILQLYRKDIGGAMAEVPLTTGPDPKYPTDWSLDGRFLLYTETAPKTGSDVWVLPLAGAGTGKPLPLVQSPFSDREATFSPDGKWFAYTSYESRSPEIYIQPFPPNGAKWMISNQHGTTPRWRNDGKELFYLNAAGTAVMATAIRVTSTGIEADSPHELFRTSAAIMIGSRYDVTRDGQRFLILQPVNDLANTLNVVLNWPAGLK